MTQQMTPKNNEQDKADRLDRRRFLARISLWAGGASAALVAVPMVGFLLAPLLRTKPRLWRDVGALSDFAVGATTDVVLEDASPLPWAGVTAKTAAWLRR